MISPETIILGHILKNLKAIDKVLKRMEYKGGSELDFIHTYVTQSIYLFENSPLDTFQELNKE